MVLHHFIWNNISEFQPSDHLWCIFNTGVWSHGYSLQVDKFRHGFDVSLNYIQWLHLMNELSTLSQFGCSVQAVPLGDTKSMWKFPCLSESWLFTVDESEMIRHRHHCQDATVWILGLTCLDFFIIVRTMASIFVLQLFTNSKPAVSISLDSPSMMSLVNDDVTGKRSPMRRRKKLH